MACRYLFLCFVASVTLACGAQRPAWGAAADAGRETGIEAGFHSMYNLDFEDAHRRFDGWHAAHPDDPMSPVSHGAAYLFAEFDRLGVLETELFTDNDRFDARKKLSADPQLKNRLMDTLATADALADRALARQPGRYQRTIREGSRHGSTIRLRGDDRETRC